ncbi:MAG TPA: glycerate kinase [Actinomycetaceae bacterium]|nr:glycerate kinase [Actinomycetaceae bacterium]
MRLLLSPGAFSGALSAVEVAAAMARGWLTTAPGTEVRTLPMSDGADGLIATVHAARGGELLPVTVAGPLGEPVPATILHVPGPAGGTAYIEAGQAIGRQLTPPGAELRDAEQGSSAGLAELVLAALDLGAGRLVIGMGEAASHDGGTGMVARLGSDPTPGSSPVTAEELAQAHRLLDGRDVVVAVADRAPLLGLHGTGALLAERAGIDPAAAQQIDTRVGEQVAALARAARTLPRRTSLMGAPEPGDRPGRTDGSGAAGGAGFALELLGARLLPGPDVVGAEIGLTEAAGHADVVLTGTAVLDADAVESSVVGTVGRAAMEHGIPVVVLAEEVQTSRREVAKSGLSATYAAGSGDLRVLEEWAARLARTWARTA